jgi:hypothetical protein
VDKETQEAPSISWTIIVRCIQSLGPNKAKVHSMYDKFLQVEVVDVLGSSLAKRGRISQTRWIIHGLISSNIPDEVCSQSKV